ncbi:MAG: VOC family protein [Candidatus Eremiobacteraeota bacterium]|nr:VOC family protein [Candidatus Eremiobacteraeota bacterium]
MAFEQTIPILRIFDVAKAREFYLDYLGFSLTFEHRFHEEAPLFMGIARGGVSIFLSEHHGDGTPGTHIVVRVRGLDALHRELAAKKYKYFKPSIQTQEWGTREMVVYDPFNNHIAFSESIERRS